MKSRRMNRLIKNILENMHGQRKMVLLLSCIVVFTTTYLLILPAFTLDKEEAAEQGGIDLSAASISAETEAEEDESSDQEDPIEIEDTEDAGEDEDPEELEDPSENEDQEESDVSPDADESAEVDATEEVVEEIIDEDESTAESPLVFEGNGYTVTASFDDDAEMPAGTVLDVNEIKYGTDEYYQNLGQIWGELNQEYLEIEEQRKDYNEGMGFLDEAKLANLDDARFFDVQLVNDDKPVELSAPAHIEISFDDGMQLEKGADTGVAFFDKDGAEIIDDSEIEGSKSVATGFSYDLTTSSDVGIFTSHETSDQGRVVNKPAARKLMKAGAAKGKTNDDLPEPYANKTLEPNHNPNGTNDGTYTLTLSVGGASKQNTYSDVTKSNVLIVMDRSSSMTSNNTYDKYTGEHKNNISYYGVLDGTISDLNNVALTYMNNRYYYQTGYTDNWGNYHVTGSTPYDGAVYTRRTRLDAEQDALATLIQELTNKNRPGETVTDDEGNTVSLDDIIEVKVISFASGRTDADKAKGFKRNGNNVDTKGTTFDNTESGWGTTYTNNSTLKKAIDDNSVAKGTNWEEAMEYAKEVADQKKAEQPDEPVFVVFLTDGEPTDIHGDNGNAQWYQDNVKCLKAAEPDAKAIVDAHDITTAAGKTVTSDHKFYGIFTYGDTDTMKSYLRRLVNYAYGKGDVGDSNVSGGAADYYFDADSTTALLNAFQNIMSQVTNTMAYGKVKVLDGLTTDAMTTTLVNGSAEGYKYTVSGPVGELYSVRAEDPENGHGDPKVTFTVNGQDYPGEKKSAAIDGKTCEYWAYTTGSGDEYKMALADLSGNGKLTWDLSGVGTLLDGYTYSASFVVWPDQDAYDYVAALNNGIKGYTWDKNASTYEDLTASKGYEKGGVEDFPSIVKYPDGVFAVLTNTEQKVEYSIVETKEEGGTSTTTYKGPYEAELPTPEPMPLTASESAIEKIWNIERDPEILAQMLYELDEESGKLVSKEYNITFDIMQGSGDTKYTDVTLGWDDAQKKYIWEKDGEKTVTYEGQECVVGTRWKEDFSIATGLMLSEARMNALGIDKSLYPSGTFDGTKYYILETGHDYMIKEPGLTFEFDFESPVYHPMLVDGVLESVNYTIDKNNNKLAEITGMTGEELGLPSLKIQNTLRGYIHLEKIVVDTDGATPVPGDDTEFTYTVELHNDTNPGPFTAEGSHVPWYGISGLYYHDKNGNFYQAEARGSNGVRITDEAGNVYNGTCAGGFKEIAGAQTVKFDGRPDLVLYGNQMNHDSDNYVSAQISIRQNQVLNIANVPVGTTYTITEHEYDGYTPVKIVREIKLSESDGNPEKSETLSGKYEISGTIATNRDNHVTYYNKSMVTDIDIQKLDETGAGLSGAVFELKKLTDAEGHSEMYASEIGSVRGLGDVTKQTESGNTTYHSAVESTGEVQRISGLTDGTYRLREVYVPAGYVRDYDYIEFTIENKVVKDVKTDKADSIDDADSLEFTAAGGNSIALLRITNTPGVALPHTGGIGTTMFYIFGTILTLVSAVMLVSRRRIQ